MNLSPHVLELLCSRLCHDLISPVGAINNGVELIEELGEEAYDDAMGLITSSAKKANIHLKSFRMAYGAAGAGTDIRPDDIKILMQDWMALTRAEFEWQPSPLLTTVLPPRGYFKCLLNAGFYMADFLGQGGKIIFQAHDQEPYGFTIIATSDKLTLHNDCVESFEGHLSPQDLSPRNIQGYILKIFCQQYGITSTYEVKDSQNVILSLKVPE